MTTCTSYLLHEKQLSSAITPVDHSYVYKFATKERGGREVGEKVKKEKNGGREVKRRKR